MGHGAIEPGFHAVSYLRPETHEQNQRTLLANCGSIIFPFLSISPFCASLPCHLRPIPTSPTTPSCFSWYSKSTFFNAITNSSAPAENFPFCTIGMSKIPIFLVILLRRMSLSVLWPPRNLCVGLGFLLERTFLFVQLINRSRGVSRRCSWCSSWCMLTATTRAAAPCPWELFALATTTTDPKTNSGWRSNKKTNELCWINDEQL